MVGDARVVSDATLCSNFAVDGVSPKCIVYPSSAEQVAAVLQCAAEHDMAVVPCRSATKLHIGNVPRRYDLALSLKEMNRVWRYEPADLTVTVEPGMKLGDFQHFLSRRGLWLPLDPKGGAHASVGGILATNSTGPLRLHYGTPRDIVLGMKIATSEGKLVQTGGRVVKNVAGYDLAKLLIGSYGTLGVIVEASLKLYPSPPQRATFSVAVDTLEAAQGFRHRLLSSPLGPMRMVLLDTRALALVRGSPAGVPLQGSHFEIWVEAGGSRRVLERYARELEELGRAVGAAVRRLEAQQAETGWARVADFHPWLAGAFSSLVILKVILPLARGEQFLSLALDEAEREQISVAVFGQTGVGVIHLCLMEGSGAASQVGLVKRLREAAEGMGGVLVVENCPAGVKVGLDVWGSMGDDFEIMRSVKAAWDPKGILAPGRFLGGV